MIPLFVLCMYFRLSIYIQTSSSSTPSTRHRHTDTFFFLPPRGAALLSPPPAFAVPIFSVPSFPSSRRPSVKRSDSEARLFFFFRWRQTDGSPGPGSEVHGRTRARVYLLHVCRVWVSVSCCTECWVASKSSKRKNRKKKGHCCCCKFSRSAHCPISSTFCIADN